MASTVIRGAQIKDSTVQRHDLDTSTVGQAVVTKIVQGTGVTLSSTGADSGTGDVTVSTSAIPLASSSASGLMNQTSGNTTDFIDGTNNSQPLQPVIWSVRLRSFNAVGNPTFEVDQRLCGTSAVFGSVFGIDRWNFQQTGLSANATGQQMSGNVVIPGTNFYITSKFLRVTLTAQKATLAAGDILGIQILVEGPMLRELLGDVTSFQVLARSSVANLSFGVALRDTTVVRSLTKLCTLSSVAGTWTLIPCPNIPVWDPGGIWVISPGAWGYALQITLAGGSSSVAPANNAWQNGNFTTAVGQSNFAASPVNSTFDIAFISHEPGAVCSMPMDCPFTGPNGNLESCQRYFTKSYAYGTKPGVATEANHIACVALGGNWPWGPFRFPKRLAKSPTLGVYDTSAGTVNAVYDRVASVQRTVTGNIGLDDSGFAAIQVSVANASNTIYSFHYTADSGW